MSLTEYPLRTFSRCVLALNDPTHTDDPGAWLTRAVASLNPMVPFDAAWWGQVEPDRPGGSAKNVMHGSLGLSPGFAEEWNTIARCDDFARNSMQRLGEAVVYNGAVEDIDTEGDAVSAFCRRHGLYHCLAVTLTFPSSGLLFFISLYRDYPQPSFSRTEAVCLEEYSAHLLNGWVQCLRRAHRNRLQDHWDCVALTSTAGRVLYIGKQLSRVLEERFDDWQGTFLPDPLTETLTTPRRIRLKRHLTGLRVQPCGHLASLTLSGINDSRLSPRELDVAQLYAQGQSYKEVARSLNVTPATVRTYLRQVYTQLGVNNKLELATTLRQFGVDTHVRWGAGRC